MKNKINKKRLFGTNGVRGVIGRDMTPELVFHIGTALGTLRRGSIAVGRDTRTSGETLIHALKAGLLATGCDVTDCGVLPTPALQYLIKGKFDGGAMITASHNPPEYNGVKIIEADGTEMGDLETIELEQHIFSRSFALQPWDKAGCEHSAPGLVDQYISAVVRQFPPSIGRGMLVVVDPGSGPACRTTPEILKTLGCQVLTVNGIMDGHFPARMPEPTPEGLAALSALVVSSGAAFGVAHDGDADRAVFVDEKGHYVEENQEFAIVARYLCQHHKGVIVTPVSTSGIVEAVASPEGCSVNYTRVGSIHVARTMHSLIKQGVDVVFGGEGNGGLIFPDHQFCRDGAMTAASMVLILATTKNRLSEIVKELPKRYMIKEKHKTIHARKLMVKIEHSFLHDHIDHTDGLKITREPSWALIRASGTEPLIRIIVESEKKKDAERFFKEISAIVARESGT